MTVLVGGVAQLYQGDLDLGRRAAELLALDDLGPDVVVEDLSYGAVAVVQRLQELRPDALVLVGAEPRGRPPGTVERREFRPATLTPAEIQGAVSDAVTGYVGIDLVLDVAHGFGALPARTVAIEVEPAAVDPSEWLSPVAEAGLEEALRLVRAELDRLKHPPASSSRPRCCGRTATRRPCGCSSTSAPSASALTAFPVTSGPPGPSGISRALSERPIESHRRW